MKYISVADLDPSYFVSNQVKNTYTRDLPDKGLNSGEFGSSKSMRSSENSLFNQSMSISALSVADDFDPGLDEQVDAKMDAEENIGICAIIEVCGYTQMLESLADKVPATAINRSLEVIIGKIYDIIHEFHGDIVKIKNDFITVFWRLKKDSSAQPDKKLERRNSSSSLIGRRSSFSSSAGSKEMKTLNKKRKTFMLGKLGASFNKGMFSFTDSDENVDFQEEKIESYASLDVLAVINAIICCEKCSLLTSQVQSWALEEYVGDQQKIKCDLRCSIGYGSVIDIQFGVTRIKCHTLCAGTAFKTAQSILVDDVARGCIIISNTVYDMANENGMTFADGQKIDLGFIIDPVPRKNNDSLFSLISSIKEHILYCDFNQRKYTSFLETYLCDQTYQLIRKKQEKVLKDDDLKSSWEKCSIMAVRIKNVVKPGENGDQYYSSIEICKRIQEILIKVQRITWANDTYTYHINTDIDQSVVIYFITYDGNGSANQKIMKIAIMMKQMLSKGTCNDLSIAITQGTCYRGILASKNRLEYRTIGPCISHADALSALPQCQKTLLIDDDCASTYLDSTASDFFISNEASLRSNSYIIPQKNHKEVSSIAHEVMGIAKTLTTSNFDLKSREFLAPKDAQKKVDLEREPSTVKWNSYMRSFLDNGSPNVIFIRGSRGSGKSKLLAQFRTATDRSDFQVITASNHENDCYATPMHVFIIIVPKLLDLIETSIKKKEREVSTARKVDNNKALLKQSSFAGSFNSIKGMFLGAKNKKPDLRSASDANSPQNQIPEEKTLNQNWNDFSRDPNLIPNLIDSMKKALIKVDENPVEALQLLNYVVIPDLEQDSLPAFKPGTRTYLLADLLARIIDKITMNRPLALLVDDLQWMASWKIMFHLMSNCKNVLFIFASREASDYRKVKIEKLIELENIVIIDADKENSNSMEAFVVRNFFNFALKLNKGYLSFINNRYGGLLMHYDAVSRTLLDLGQYELRNYEIALPFTFNENALPRSYDEIIKWQFNRLPSKPFQKLAKCASIVGRQFSMDDLCAVWPNVYSTQRKTENTTNLKQYLLGTLLLNDYFEFFERINDGDEDITDSNPCFHFRFAEVRNVIRSHVMNDGERLMRQRNLISHYEKQLTTITEPFHIPLISYHYSITYTTDLNTLQKRIKYLLMLGAYLCNCTESYMEAQYIFMQVDRILEKYGLHERIGPYLSTEWDLNMAITCGNCPEEFANPHKSIDYLINGLSKLGYEWANSKEELARIIVSKSALVSIISWKILHFERHRKNKISPAKSKALSYHQSLISRSDFVEELERVDATSRWRRISLFLSLLSVYLSKVNGSLYEQLALHLSILSINLNHDPGNVFQNTLSFINVALMLLYLGKTNTSFFIFKNISRQLETGDTLLHNSPESFSLSMVYLTATGNWEMIYDHSAECLKFCKANGSIPAWFVTIRQKILVLTFNGLFDQAIALANIAKNESKAGGRITQSRRFRAVQMCITILKGFTQFFPKDEDLISLQDSEKGDQVLSFLLSGIKSQLYILSNQFEEAFHEVDTAIDLMGIISIENTEIMYGILLVTLSLYSIYEREVLARKSSSSAGTRRMSTIIRNISRVTGGKRSSSVERKSSLAYSEVLDRNESHMSSPRPSVSSGKLIDQWKQKEVKLTQQVQSYAVRVSKLLANMPCHFLVQKLHILVRALERKSDPVYASFYLNLMKEEAKRLANGKDSKTKYLAIVLLIKSSNMFEKADESRILADKLCSENKIQTCLSIL